MESLDELVEQRKLAGKNGEIAGSLGKLNGQKKQTSENEDISAVRQILPQVLATTAKNFHLLTLGMMRALPAIVIPVVTNPNNNSTLHLTLEQASWYGGFTYIFHPVGSLIAGALLQSLGCKKLMILSNIPVLACWVLSYRASDILDLYFSGALIGFVCGLLGAPPTRYTSETVHPSVRSILTTYSQLFISFGFFSVYFLSSLIGWRHVALICGIVPIVCTTALFWVPESPMWLMSKGRPEEALKSLQWLRGWTSAEAIKEEFSKLKIYAKKKEKNERLAGFRQMLKELEEEEEEGQSLMVAPWTEKYSGNTTVAHENTGNTQDIPIDSNLELEEYSNEKSLREKLREISRPDMFVPLCKIMLVFTAVCFCSAAPMQPFMIKIYDELKLPVQGTTLAAFLSLMNFCNGILFMLIVKKVGKKRLFMICSTFCIICVIVLTVFTRQLLADQENDPSNESITRWTVLALFITNSCSLSVGVWHIPWILLGEILPFKGRGIATGIAVSYHYIFIFIGVKLYPILVELLNLDGTLLFFAIGSIPCVIAMYFLIPETEGKFLADIEAENTQIIKGKA